MRSRQVTQSFGSKTPTQSGPLPPGPDEGPLEMLDDAVLMPVLELDAVLPPAPSADSSSPPQAQGTIKKKEGTATHKNLVSTRIGNTSAPPGGQSIDSLHGLGPDRAPQAAERPVKLSAHDSRKWALARSAFVRFASGNEVGGWRSPLTGEAPPGCELEVPDPRRSRREDAIAGWTGDGRRAIRPTGNSVISGTGNRKQETGN